MHQVSGLLDQVLMYSLAMLSSSGLPVHHGALIQTKSRHDGLHRTTKGDQGHHACYQIHRVVQPVEGRARSAGKRLAAQGTFVTCFFPAVDNDVALAGFAPCGAGYIRAELCLRVHWLFLGSGKHKNATGLSFFQPSPRFSGALPAAVPNKKKIISLGRDFDPQLLPGNPFSFRAVQDPDKSYLLDQVGEYCINSLKLQKGPIPKEKTVGVLNNVVGFCYTSLEKLVSSLSPTRLLDYFITQHEAIVSERAQRWLTIPTQLACFGNFNELVTQVQKQNTEINEAAMACRFLIEYVTAKPPRGLRSISLTVYDELMVLASEIISRGSHSDLVKYQIFDIDLSVLPSGRLGFNRAEYEAANNTFSMFHSREEIDYAGRYFTSWWRIRSDSPPEDYPAHVKALDRAYLAEYGFQLTDLSQLTSEIGNIGLDIGHDEFKRIELSILINRLADITSWDSDKVSKLVNFLLLQPRDKFLNPPTPYHSVDVYPWRMSRALSYIRRPLLLLEENTGSYVCWGTRHLFAAFEYIKSMSIKGRLQDCYESKEMREFLSKARHQDGKSFNSKVEQAVSQLPGLIVRAQMKKIGDLRIGFPESDLGDIDVFVLAPQKKRVLLIECKNMQVGRTPIEMSRELKELFATDIGTSTVMKHLNRKKWVQQNLNLVLQEFGLTNRGSWKIDAILVVSEEMLTPYYYRSPIPVFSFLNFVNTFLPSI